MALLVCNIILTSLSFNLFIVIVQIHCVPVLKDTPKAIEEDFKSASQAFSKTFRQNPLQRPDEKKIPQYMMNLYRAIADDNGRWRKNAKIEGNIVRSIYSEEGNTERSGDKNGYYFNVNDIDQSESMVKAELRLFKHRKTPGDKRQHYYQVEIWDLYQKRVVSARMISAMSYGWEQFPLTDVIKGWIGKSGLNKGLKVQIRKIFPGQKGFTFAEASDKNREPILVINSNDYRPFKIQKPANLTDGTTSVTSEKKNRIRQGRDSLHSMCERRDMIVDVNKISWNNWILEPKVFNLYRCVGHCGVYNSKTSGEQTNHATMQAVLAETGLHSGSKVDLPCCAPRKLEPMAMLLYEKYGSTVVVKLKSLDNMIVSSCACL